MGRNVGCLLGLTVGLLVDGALLGVRVGVSEVGICVDGVKEGFTLGTKVGVRELGVKLGVKLGSGDGI